MQEGLAFCELLDPLVDALDITGGNYDTAMILLPMGAPGSLLGYAKAVKQRVSVPVIGVGRLTWLIDDLQQAVGNGEFDLVSLGRSQLADPDTVVKTRRGEPERVRRCLAVNECVSRWMFNGQHTQCVINPVLGQGKRAEEARRPAPVGKRVLIAGAGPAGCEAALLAAARGHDVEIAECRDRIGGQLHAWGAASTFRAQIANLIAFYEGELRRSGVTLRLGTAVESLDLAGYDHVLLATGTVTADTGIDAVAMLDSGVAPAADEVTVFGETETALFAALWLAEQGKRTTLVSPVEGVGVDSNDMESGHLAGQLDALGVTVLTNTPDPGGPDVVRATARIASDAVELAVDGERVRAVGSRLRGGRMYEATQSGFWAATQI